MHILVRLFAPLINMLVGIINLFIRRDREIVLVGAWMGNRFADNSRFLFQYLSSHKNEYQCKKIIWVTRNPEILYLLRKMKYEAYMMHSLKSFYYHLKAGVTIICNISFPVRGYHGDLMGCLSGNSIKINTWHGIPIKAGKSTGENVKNEGLKGKVKYTMRKNGNLMSVFTPGHWDKAYYLSTSSEATRRCSIFCGVDKSQFIESGYPRDCISDDMLLDTEKNAIEKIHSYSKSVLYVPTFRENSEVPHPLSDEALKHYLSEKHLLWIEKPHAASHQSTYTKNDDYNILLLPSTFDVNVLLKNVDLIITDYSSICYDAIAYNRPVLYYAPDVDRYIKNERGFLCDYRNMVKGFVSFDIPGLIDQIDRSMNNKEFQLELYNKNNDESSSLLTDTCDNCKQIIQKINERIGVLGANT